jgi:hypothetical protein
MNLMRAGIITFAIFSSVSFAAAQRGPGTSQVDLTPPQERMVSQGLASAPTQPMPSGEQPKVGSAVPGSLTAQSMPSSVSDQVPEAKGLLFVKLPDRIVLIDPDTKLVTEIVIDSATTGANPSRAPTNPSSPGAR